MFIKFKVHGLVKSEKPIKKEEDRENVSLECDFSFICVYLKPSQHSLDLNNPVFSISLSFASFPRCSFLPFFKFLFLFFVLAVLEGQTQALAPAMQLLN